MRQFALDDFDGAPSQENGALAVAVIGRARRRGEVPSALDAAGTFGLLIAPLHYRTLLTRRSTAKPSPALGS
ncbi:TetR/AcrR family transcriptional regulator C-terminal ligand-binding domain-containing protein [Rhodococcus aerolatus]